MLLRFARLCVVRPGNMRPLTFHILRELSVERFTSGAALASQFDVSRSAISDALKEASDNGVEIFKLTRRGYKLAAPLDLLNLDLIRQLLDSQAGRVNIEVLDSVDSTNSELTRRIAHVQLPLLLPSGTCVVTEIQTAGRGRRGRMWQSGLGTSLTFSLLWRFEKGAAQLGGLSLVVGLAIVKALRAQGLVEAQVKWPNDILVGSQQHQKLGGILIETQGDMLGPTAAVIGIGINVNLPSAMKRAIDQPVTDFVSHSMMPITRNALLVAILQALLPALGKFNTLGFAAFRHEWLGLHAYQDCVVTVSQAGGEPFSAMVSGVANDGSLLVKPQIGNTINSAINIKEIALSSAEISIRSALVREQNDHLDPRESNKTTTPSPVKS